MSRNVLKIIENLLGGGERLWISGAPDGMEALVLADLARQSAGGVLHIARDDARLAATVAALEFFAPELEVLTLPAWDCLPYDRVSPNPVVCSRRMGTLSRLAEAEPKTGTVLATTVSAVLQRLPPRSTIAGATFRAAPGDVIPRESLTTYLGLNGYLRAGTVVEPGEYAVRGGIVDIFPPEGGEPLRLDFFGDTLESVRVFDPVSQRTTGTRGRADLLPVSEIRLDPDTIARFRSGYTEEFGAVTDADPMYEALSAGRRHQGMEHWLPLFHEGLETVFDYAPQAAVTLDHLAEDARDSRLAMIADYYQARRSAYEGATGYGSLYKPLPPHRLHLSAEDWEKALDKRPTAAFTAFRLPDEAAASDAGARDGRDFGPERAQREINLFDAVRDHISALLANHRVLITCHTMGSRERLEGVLKDHGIDGLTPVAHFSEAERLAPGSVALAVLPLDKGFEMPGLAVISEQDILGDRMSRRPRRARRADDFLTEASTLGSGDIVVHVEHGIGRFDGLQTIEVAGAPHDCLVIIYDGDDKLYLPVENIEMLSRYGTGEAAVRLDRLGSSQWQARKARLKKRIRDIANQLIAVAATRARRTAEALLPPPGIYEEFCARFPYEETEDQNRAIEDLLADLGSRKLMDRLICGDVGFGKTEVALRGALVAAMEGRQVAIVVPTTLLCRQHFATFTERFAGLPLEIRQISRLVSSGKAAETRKGLASGHVDIVIGTHALLAKNIEFKRLGLLVIDEEQHFGVTHKERLKTLKGDVHVLTLTATPIPRTLQMALSGVRDMSLIATPPVDRLAVRTFVLPFDGLIVREAILREHYRGGQCFYVCPRIADLDHLTGFLKEQIPEVKFAVAHGQMAARQLEDVMTGFYEGAFDVLLSTTIVESGLDIPTANTLIVHRADRYGLAQLYQLRGRIGRSKLRAYAYFTIPTDHTITESAEKRLRVMQSLDALGAGFQLASHDLDIRGAGNLLGEEQSGQIKEVGVELYQHMLEEAVAEARGETRAGADDSDWTPQITTGAAVLIPDHYVADLDLRLGLYRRIGDLADRPEIDSFAAEMIDRFGPLPEELEHLLKIVEIKASCRRGGIEKIETGPKGATIAFRANQFRNPGGLVAYISEQVGTARLKPDHRLVLSRSWPTAEHRLDGAFQVARELADIADQEEASAAAGSPATLSNS